MLLASRVSVDVFKKLRGFCQQWLDSDKAVMRRTALVGVLLLTQGRGQVVKGDLPRLSETIQGLLPKQLSDLEVKSDEARLVGDEGCAVNDEFSLYTLNLTSLNPYVDWCVALLLLNELYARFTQPMHVAVRTNKDLLNHCSVLLVSQHCFPRLSAVLFFKHYFAGEFAVSSGCDSESWLQEPGAVFFVLQRVFISYHLSHTNELIRQQSELLSEVLCGFGEKGEWARPKYLNNKELRVLCGFGEEEEEGEKKEDVRQFYDMDLIEEEASDEEEKEMEEESDDEESEKEESEESEKEEESEESEKEEEKEESEKEEEKKKKGTRLFNTLHRVPNPHRFEDCLFLVGSTMAMNDSTIKQAMMDVIETITAVMTAQAIETHIVRGWCVE